MKHNERVKKIYSSSVIPIELSDFHFQVRSRHFSNLDKIDLNKLSQSLYLRFINSLEYQRLGREESNNITVNNISFQSKFFSERKNIRKFIESLSKYNSVMYTVYSQDSFWDQNFFNLRYLKDILKNVNSSLEEQEEPVVSTPRIFNSKTLIRLQNTLISNHTSDEKIKRKTERREIVKNIYPLVDNMYQKMISSFSNHQEVVFQQKGFSALSLLEENKKIFMKDVSLFKRYKKDLSCDDGWGVFSFVTSGKKRQVVCHEYMMMEDYLDYDFNKNILESVNECLEGIGKKVTDLKNLVLVCPDWDIASHILKPFFDCGIDYSMVCMDDMIVGWNPTISTLNFLYTQGVSVLIKFDSFPYYEIYLIE